MANGKTRKPTINRTRSTTTTSPPIAGVSTREVIFTPLVADDIVSDIDQTISTGIWTGDTGSLNAFYTSSTQSGSTGNYYLDVYDKVGSDSTREVQFAVTYGHYYGSGSETGDNTDAWATQAIYKQYGALLLNGSSKFTISGSTTDEIFVVNVNRERYKERVDPGNWELTLSGSIGAFTYIDDSGAKTDITQNFGKIKHGIKSGSLTDGTTGDEVGLFYPYHGLMVFDAAVSGTVGWDFGTSADADDYNSYDVFNAIDLGESFTARSEEQISSRHFFCRVKNNKYNYSSNPTYVTGSDGNLMNTDMKTDPKTYITTVGLYDGASNLIAIGKLSQPLQKTFSKEALLKIKLDF